MNKFLMLVIDRPFIKLVRETPALNSPYWTFLGIFCLLLFLHQYSCVLLHCFTWWMLYDTLWVTHWPSLAIKSRESLLVSLSLKQLQLIIFLWVRHLPWNFEALNWALQIIAHALQQNHRWILFPAHCPRVISRFLAKRADTKTQHKNTSQHHKINS